MKKVALLFINVILLLSLVGCSKYKSKDDINDNFNRNSNYEDDGNKDTKPSEPTSKPIYSKEDNEIIDDDVINIWSLNGDFTKVINKFIELHPDFAYEIQITDLSNANFSYDYALYDTLVNGTKTFGLDVPDIYPVEMSYAYRYTQGEAYQYAADYKDLAIDTDELIAKASIPQYYIDLCTSPLGKLIGLGYDNTAGAFIYRRSIARDVWGTDDPSAIEAIIGPGWESFFKAAEDLKAKNYGICSGIFDIWHLVENSADQGWLVDGKPYIDPKREKFLDYAKKLKDNEYTNNTMQWSEEWFLDMRAGGEKDILGFFGPSWLVNYIIAPYSELEAPYIELEATGEGTYGDWAICNPPVGFFWGGTVILAHKDTKHKEAVGEIIKWLTLDTTETGFQYLWASNKDAFLDIKGVPSSATVTRDLYASTDFLGGQDMFEVYASAGGLTRGDNLSPYDESINGFWRNEVYEYINGNKSREEAIADFKKQVDKYLDMMSE